VKKDEPVTIFGQSAPDATVKISVDIEYDSVKTITADHNGIWKYVLDTEGLESGIYTTKARATLNQSTTIFSHEVKFAIGNAIIKDKPKRCRIGDLNNDCRTNIIDFSILAYWYKRPLTQAVIDNGNDLNNDNKTDILDFSVMAYYWTG
ncbi:MAG: hypothetical protein K0S38_648, partial [Candidatus Paceibacter sp.]|nr:hypothetical protein [Candidatus Paceibacter sp.]